MSSFLTFSLSDLLLFFPLFSLLKSSTNFFRSSYYLRMSWRRSRWSRSGTWTPLKSPDWTSGSLGVGPLTGTSSESESERLTCRPYSPMKYRPGTTSGIRQPIWVLYLMKFALLLYSTPSNWRVLLNCESAIPIILPCYCRYDPEIDMLFSLFQFCATRLIMINWESGDQVSFFFFPQLWFCFVRFCG